MIKRTFFMLLTLLFTVVISVACSSNDAGGDAQNNEVEETETNEDPEDVTNEESGEREDTNAETERSENTEVSESSSTGNKDLPDTIEMNEEIITDTGLIFLLEKITFEDDHIAVDFHAENNSGFEKYLAADGEAYDENLGGITLQDDTGFDYRYVAAGGEAMINVKNQETVDGTVRFLGKVRDEAQTLTLIFNPEEDSKNSPRFEFEDIEIQW